MKPARALVPLFATAIVVLTAGFEINPLHRTLRPRGGIRDAITEPVHERITREARELFAKRCHEQGGSDCDRGIAERTIQDSLLRGVWWSDDPNQDLYQGRHLLWVTNLKRAGRRAVDDRYTIDGKYKMMYRSHYGDMQFLHSMASAKQEEGDVTRERMHMWGHFLYLVATGRVDQHTRFSDVPVPGLAAYFQRQKDWEIRWILQPHFLLRDTPHDFEDHALGALLHMVQDSYSAAHVERDYTASATCPLGRVVRFNTYVGQDPDRHGAADKMAALEKSRFPEGGGPVAASAQLIWFARNGADWETEVVPWLDRDVYCFDGKPLPGDPGEFAKL